MIFGVDIGAAQVKAVSNNWKTKFPSLVKKAASTDVTFLGDSDGYTVKRNGETWRVGSKGSFDFSAEERITQDLVLP